tara:strand:+ start:771 stop:1109 length:339 start_codon:yes stop_codon:yes gene_type:complete
MIKSKNWKEVTIAEKRLSSRMSYVPVEGGALNAGYTTVDAVANLCTTAGNLGMVYGKDFIWSHTGWDEKDDDAIVLLVKEEKYETFLQLAIKNKHKIKHTDTGEIHLTKETA